MQTFLGGGFCAWDGFSDEIIFCEEENSRSEFSRGNFLYLFYFVFAYLLVHGEICQENCRRENSLRVGFPENKFHGREDF